MLRECVNVFGESKGWAVKGEIGSCCSQEAMIGNDYFKGVFVVASVGNGGHMWKNVTDFLTKKKTHPAPFKNKNLLQ